MPPLWTEASSDPQAPASGGKRDRVNVVLIMNDTLRYDHVGANGNHWIHTPNLDHFAAESAAFDEAFLGSFPTIPCRHEMMKGRYGDPFQKWGPLQWDALTLPEVLRDNGYVTMLINDTPHLINYGYGFDRPFHAWEMIRGNEVDRARTDYFEEIQYRVDTKVQDSARMSLCHRHTGDRRTEADWFAPQVMRAACDWLERNAGHDNFFLWVDSFDPHEPWDPPKHYVDLYDPGYEGLDIVWPPHCNPEGKFSEAELNHIVSAHPGVAEKLHRELLTFFRRNRAPRWVLKLYTDGPDGIPPPPTAMFDEVAFKRGLPFGTPLSGNVV